MKEIFLIFISVKLMIKAIYIYFKLVISNLVFMMKRKLILMKDIIKK